MSGELETGTVTREDIPHPIVVESEGWILIESVVGKSV